MVVKMSPCRVVYCEEIHQYVLNIGPYHLWFDTLDEAYHAWDVYRINLGMD